jgi:hypothetical protein
MLDFSEELFEPFKKWVDERDKTPTQLKIFVNKRLEDQSICNKFPVGKDFYLVMGYEFFRNFKKETDLTVNTLTNVVSWAGVPIYFDDQDMCNEIFSEEKGT